MWTNSSCVPKKQMLVDTLLALAKGQHPAGSEKHGPYYSDDLAGAEIGGAVKNVLAIACGVVDGLALGQNARAALIARGYAEMLRFGEALGARAETLAGLCGLGDLVLTCSSTASRNFSLGKALGEGGDPAALLADRRTVAEGAFTAPVLARENMTVSRSWIRRRARNTAILTASGRIPRTSASST